MLTVKPSAGAVSSFEAGAPTSRHGAPGTAPASTSKFHWRSERQNSLPSGSRSCQVVTVISGQACVPLHQPFQFGLDRIALQVQVDTVLHDFLLGHQLEEDPRLPAQSFD